MHTKTDDKRKFVIGLRSFVTPFSFHYYAAVTDRAFRRYLC